MLISKKTGYLDFNRCPVFLPMNICIYIYDYNKIFIIMLHNCNSRLSIIFYCFVKHKISSLVHINMKTNITVIKKKKNFHVKNYKEFTN